MWSKNKDEGISLCENNYTVVIHNIIISLISSDESDRNLTGRILIKQKPALMVIAGKLCVSW